MRKGSLTALLAGVAALAGCGLGGGGADSSNQALGPDGTEFVSVTVANAKCKSIVLRGTNQFKGRAFVMPQAYVAVDDNQRTIFQTIPNPNGGYTLRIGVYFPASGTVDSAQPNSANIYVPDCTYDEIKAGVNANLADADKIGYPEPLLVNYITSRIQGLTATALIGTLGTDVLSYAGKTAILEFAIPDQAALASMVDRLRRGTQLDFDMTFSARTADGFVSVDVDLSKVSDALAATVGSGTDANGSVHGVGVHVATQEEFRMKMAQVLTNMNLDVSIIGSTDDAFNKLAQQIIDKMVTSNPAVQVQPADLPAGVDPPVPPGGGVTTPAAPGSPPPAAGSGSPLSAGVSVNVDAAVQALKAMGTYHVQVQRDSALVQKTYTTWTIIQANYSDPGTQDVLPYSDHDGEVMSQDVKKGMTVAIIPTARDTQNIQYNVQPTYFMTKADVLAPEHNMQGRFDLLRDYPNSIKESSGSPAYMYAESGWKIYTWITNWDYYNWGFEKQVASFSDPVTHRFTDADFDDFMNAVKVEFNDSGKLFSLNDLGAAKVANGDLVDGTLDRKNQRVVISPGSDLGRLKVFNGDAFPHDQQIYDKHYFQRHMGGYGRGQLDIQYSDQDQPTMVPSQRSKLYVRLVADQGSTGSVTAVTTSGGDGALHGPPATPAPH